MEGQNIATLGSAHHAAEAAGAQVDSQGRMFIRMEGAESGTPLPRAADQLDSLVSIVGDRKWELLSAEP